MTNLLLLLILTLARAPASTSDTLAEPCPSTQPAQLARLQQFFAAEQTYPFRSAHGLLGIGPADVRALTDAHDATVCTRLASALRIEQDERYPKVWRGYQAGSFYIMVVSTEVPPGVLYYGSGGMVVLNADMTIVAAADF